MFFYCSTRVIYNDNKDMVKRGDISMVMKLSDLRKLSNKELWKLYDQRTEHVEDSLDYYWKGILRSEQSKQTTWLIILTILVLIATILSTIAIFVK